MLGRVLVQLSAVVALMVAVSIAVFVGRYRLRETIAEWRDRVRAAAPITVLLAIVLLFNSVARQVVPDLSWIVGWNATWAISDIEGQFILWLQSHATAAATAYFSFIYIYGYVFLLVFPLVAYFALSNTRPLRELLTAYTLNYALGLLCYTFVIAYGPRNLMPEVVALLYDTYPEYQHLTRQVNRNTNVFPSLHASLAATVTFLAYRTRAVYPKWFLVATVLGVSVAISTMYLGIHWAIDVVAGIGLGYVSVALASALVGRWSLSAWLEDRVAPLRGIGDRGRSRGRDRPDAEADPKTEAKTGTESEAKTGTESEAKTGTETGTNADRSDPAEREPRETKRPRTDRD